ncbi:MAG: hypothetical protein E3J90_03920 [Promethearchaeota archaeon]|nr:MAG: hypothetical protein E3J90_03920 [Candidatus Lokiarchaeota archaeon]
MCEEIKFDLIKEIHVEYNTEIIDWLKEKGYKYNVQEIKDITPYQSEEEIEDKKLYFGFDPELINKYSKIATFLRWSLEELLEDILKSRSRQILRLSHKLFEEQENFLIRLEVVYTDRLLTGRFILNYTDL